MRYTLSIFLFALFCSTGFAQKNDVLLLPDRQKGQWREFAITHTEKEINDGEEASSVTEDFTMRVEVVGGNILVDELEVTLDNVMFTNAVQLNGTIAKGAKGYETVTLMFSVNKKDGTTLLTNTKELSKQWQTSYKELIKAAREEDKEIANELTRILEPYAAIMKDEEGVRSFFGDQIDFMTFPIGRSYYLGDTLHKEMVERNPFSQGPDSMLTVDRLSYLIDLDKAERHCEVAEERIMDLAPFIRSMVEVAGAAKGKKLSEEEAAALEAKMEEAIKNLHFEVNSRTTVVMDLDTVWPISAEITESVVGDDGNTRSERSSHTIILETDRSKK